MSATVRKINDWFRNANRYDVNELLEYNDPQFLEGRQPQPQAYFFTHRSIFFAIACASVNPVLYNSSAESRRAF